MSSIRTDDVIMHVMEVSGCSESAAMMALENAEGDTDVALGMLLRESQQNGAAKIRRASLAAKQRANIQELLGMGFPKLWCEIALDENNNQLSEAADWIAQNQAALRSAYPISASNLQTLMKSGQPRAWCEEALNVCNGDLQLATVWLEKNASQLADELGSSHTICPCVSVRAYQGFTYYFVREERKLSSVINVKGCVKSSKLQGYHPAAISKDTTPFHALEGYLHKESFSIMRTVRRRYFKLNNQFLLWYKKFSHIAKGKPPLGCLNLQKIAKQRYLDSNIYLLFTDDVQRKLIAVSRQQAEMWVTAIAQRVRWYADITTRDESNRKEAYLRRIKSLSPQQLNVISQADDVNVLGNQIIKLSEGWHNGTCLIGDRLVSGKGRWAFRMAKGDKSTVGVCLADTPVEGFFNTYGSGWGFYQANGKIGNGGPAKTPFGDSFTLASDWVGDVIEIEVDADRGTMQIWKNGNNQGIAFSNLPRGGAGIGFVGAVSLYDVDDKIIVLDHYQSPSSRRASISSQRSRNSQNSRRSSDRSQMSTRRTSVERSRAARSFSSDSDDEYNGAPHPPVDAQAALDGVLAAVRRGSANSSYRVSTPMESTNNAMKDIVMRRNLKSFRDVVKDNYLGARNVTRRKKALGTSIADLVDEEIEEVLSDEEAESADEGESSDEDHADALEVPRRSSVPRERRPSKRAPEHPDEEVLEEAKEDDCAGQGEPVKVHYGGIKLKKAFTNTSLKKKVFHKRDGRKFPCDHYRLDLTGESYGVCVCGFMRHEHAASAFKRRKAPKQRRHKSVTRML
eukprot:g2988.t1